MKSFACFLVAFVFLGSSCFTSDDDLGYDSPMAHPLVRLLGPTSYPNPFRDQLGKSASEIDTKVKGFYARLFHGSADDSIFVAAGSDQAFIQDTLHDDVRTEGMGLAMLIALELDQRDDFQRLWAYATANLQIATGPSAGYFRSFCETSSGGTESCLDPFGLQQFLMSLVLAHDRWGRPFDDSRFEQAAQKLLTLIRLKERLNGGRLQGITNTFDRATHLVFSYPDNDGAADTRPAAEMPAYYDLWQQATGDPFWGRAASEARAYWQRVAHPRTGLMPMRTNFEGTPLLGWEAFRAESFRSQIQVAFDVLWGDADAWGVTESERLLSFFASRGLQTYGRSFSVDGTTELDSMHDVALVAANGISAAVVRPSLGKDFVQAVWDADFPTGNVRYYRGLLQLLALVVLSGQLRVY